MNCEYFESLVDRLQVFADLDIEELDHYYWREELKDAAATIRLLLAKIETLKQQSGWIKVTPETMPNKGQKCILTTKNPDGSKTTDIATYGGESLGWIFHVLGFHSCSLEDDGYQFEITHWMPLPEPAKEDD